MVHFDIHPPFFNFFPFFNPILNILFLHLMYVEWKRKYPKIYEFYQFPFIAFDGSIIVIIIILIKD